MDFDEVVAFVLNFIATNNIAGEGVIRDLRCKSMHMACSEWMIYFHTSIGPKTYQKIKSAYAEHMKPDLGFSTLNHQELQKMDRFYSDPFAVEASSLNDLGSGYGVLFEDM